MITYLSFVYIYVYETLCLVHGLQACVYSEWTFWVSWFVTEFRYNYPTFWHLINSMYVQVSIDESVLGYFDVANERNYRH